MRRNLYAIRKNIHVNKSIKINMTDIIGAIIAVGILLGLILPIALCIFMLMHG